MPKYSIQAPNGKTYQVDGPAGATDDQVRAEVMQQFPEAGGDAPASVKMNHYTAKGKAGKPDVPFQLPENATDEDVHKAAAAATGDKDYLRSTLVPQGEAPPDTRPTSFFQGVGEGALNVVNHGAEWLNSGLNELGGVGDAINQWGADHLGTAPSVAAAEADQQRRIAERPVQASGLGKFVGTAATIAPAAVSAGASLPGLVLSGAGAGALMSDSKTAGGVAKDAALGAAGSVVGGKIVAPAIGAVASKAAPFVKKGVQSIAQMAGLGEGSTAAASAAPDVSPRVGDILLKKLTAQGQTPQAAGQMIDQAQARGVPLALMDTGDETRELASALARKPGPSRTIIRDAVIPRQEAQLDRVQGAIRRDLGDTANVRQQSESLIQQARTAAAPLYDKAYAAPSITTPDLEKVLATPAAQQAIARARTIAANEMRDPEQLGFVLDKEGKVVLNPVGTVSEGADGELGVSLSPKTQKGYSPQTLDYVKRGLDDVVEAHRDPITGRLNLDEAGRAINGVRAKFLAQVDKLNPDYAAARQAYAGPASMASALAKGAKIGTRDSEQILAETQTMTAPELEQYKLGVRSALSKALEGKTDGADKVRVLVGTPAKRKALAQVFGGIPEFNNFLKTLADEGQAAATHARVATGSQTAANLADDADANGLTGVAVNAGRRVLSGHGMTSNAVHTLADLYHYGAGKSGEEARAQLAAGISETDPVMLRNFLEAAKASGTRRATSVAGRKVGGLAGAYVASQRSQ